MLVATNSNPEWTSDDLDNFLYKKPFYWLPKPANKTLKHLCQLYLGQHSGGKVVASAFKWHFKMVAFSFRKKKVIEPAKQTIYISISDSDISINEIHFF